MFSGAGVFGPFIDVGRAALRFDLIGPISFVGEQTIDHWIAECFGVSAGLPDGWMHDDSRVQTDDVFALLRHAAPPGLLEIALELRAERAVIPKSVDPSVKLGRLENEATPLAEGDNFFHALIYFRFGHRIEEGVFAMKWGVSRRAG